MTKVNRSAHQSLTVATLALLACSCATSPNAAGSVTAAGQSSPTRVSPAHVRDLLSVLASDSMEGRATGTRGSARASAFIAAEMQRIGLEPGGDARYLQRIPISLQRVARRPRQAGGETTYVERPVTLPSVADLDTVPSERRRSDVNVVGVIRGTDPAARDSAVVVGAHFDHVGIGEPVNGDSIYNGADDDASGVVAVLEIARALRVGPAPRRTVVFVAFTGEEVGGVGSRWYLAHPVVPLARTVAQLQVEMIGRPDSLAGGPGRAWLTGYERSTMGEMLRAAAIPIVADPRPDMQFFRRSDNIAFAYVGIPAHTLSTFNMHTDYHRPSDEVSRVDFDHMAQVIDAAVRATRILADGPAPQWKPGGKPEP